MNKKSTKAAATSSCSAKTTAKNIKNDCGSKKCSSKKVKNCK